MRLLLILMFILTGFRVENPDLIKVKINPFTDKETKLYLSDLASEVKYIKLETKPECMISDIDKVLTDKGNVFVSTYSQGTDRRLYLFSDDGKFVRQFGKQGRGPGEYSSITDFTIDKTNKIIYFIDSMGTLFVYEYNGKLVRTEKADFRPDRIIYLDNKLFMIQAWPKYFLNHGYAVTIREVAGKKADIIVLSRSYLNISGYGKAPYVYGNMSLREEGTNSVSLFDAKFDTLYHISAKGEVLPEYIFSLEDIMPQMLLSSEEYLKSYKSYNSYSSLMETDKYLIFEVWTYKKSAFLYFFDKTNGQLLKHNTDFGKQYIYNDIDGGFSFHPGGIAESNTLYSVVNASRLKSKAENPGINQAIKNEQAHKNLLTMIKSADLNDNPVLMLVKLK